MAISFTYATLKAALLDFMVETGAAYTAAIDTIIPLGETQLLRDLDLEIFDVTEPLAFTAASPLLTKPTGFLASRSLYYTDANGNEQLLLPKTWEYIKEYWPKASTTVATPKYFTDYSETQWYLGGTPSGTNVVTSRHMKRPTGLSSGNATTWLGTNVGDALLYSCLASSEEYLKADNRVAVWKAEYAEKLKAALKELKPSTRHDYMPVTNIPTKE